MNPSAAMLRHWSLVAVGLCASLGRGAYAQDARVDLARRDLISRAERARVAGDHAEALRLGLQAAQIRTTPSLRLMLAEEYSALGQPVDALDQASSCEREASADTGLRNRETILAACQGLVAANESRIARLVVDVTPRDAPGLRVFVGDTELPRVLLGIPTPTAAGIIAVRVESQSVPPTSRQLSLRAGQTETLRINLARPEPADPSPVAPTRGAPPGDSRHDPSRFAPTLVRESPVPTPNGNRPAPRVSAGVSRVRAGMSDEAPTRPSGQQLPFATPQTAPPSTLQRDLGWVALAAGLVGLGVGVSGVFYAVEGASAYNHNQLSDGSRCPGTSVPFAAQPLWCQEYLRWIANAETMQQVGFVAGGILAVTGALLLITAPTRRSSQIVNLRFGVNSLGLGIHCGGTF
jgi:hypothetical protein